MARFTINKKNNKGDVKFYLKKIVGEFSNLSDVDISTVGIGKYFTWNGTKFVFGDIGPSDFIWTIIMESQNIFPKNGYITSGTGILNLTLPSTSYIGDTIKIVNYNNGWKIVQRAGQQIFIGNTNTTLGPTGYLQSSDRGDSIELVCIEANKKWIATNIVGNIIVN